jgi:hypothetical protein
MPTLHWTDQPGRFDSRREAITASRFQAPHRSLRDEAPAAGKYAALPLGIITRVGTIILYACVDLTISLGPFLGLVLLFPAMLVVGLVTNWAWLVIAVLAMVVAISVARDLQEDQANRTRRTSGAH